MSRGERHFSGSRSVSFAATVPGTSATLPRSTNNDSASDADLRVTGVPPASEISPRRRWHARANPGWARRVPLFAIPPPPLRYISLTRYRLRIGSPSRLSSLHPSRFPVASYDFLLVPHPTSPLEILAEHQYRTPSRRRKRGESPVAAATD